MQLIPLKSRLVQSGDDLKTLILETIEANGQILKTGDIVMIASKVLAYAQGLLVHVDDKDEFKQLIRREADEVLDEGLMMLTMKDGVLIPNAGIDNSNTPANEVVLWPEHSFEQAAEIRRFLMDSFDLDELGILISDSHCHPLRWGTSGIALGWAGFEGVKDERGAEDLFGRKMLYTKIAVADNLASASNLLMGETNEQIPFVITRGYQAKFTDKLFKASDYFMHPRDCLYSPLYRQCLIN